MDVLVHACPSCLRFSDFCFMDVSPHLRHTQTPPRPWGATPRLGRLGMSVTKEGLAQHVSTHKSVRFLVRIRGHGKGAPEEREGVWEGEVPETSSRASPHLPGPGGQGRGCTDPAESWASGGSQDRTAATGRELGYGHTLTSREGAGLCIPPLPPSLLLLFPLR